MRTDTYTKIMLTVIAFMLTLIACKTVISPEQTATAEGPFSGLQFHTSPNNSYTFFDAKTGEIWIYIQHADGRPAVESKLRLVKLGEPLVWEIPKWKQDQK